MEQKILGIDTLQLQIWHDLCITFYALNLWSGLHRLASYFSICRLQSLYHFILVNFKIKILISNHFFSFQSCNKNEKQERGGYMKVFENILAGVLLFSPLHYFLFKMVGCKNPLRFLVKKHAWNTLQANFFFIFKESSFGIQQICYC